MKRADVASVPIGSIASGTRFREQLGDLSDLMSSIERLGLLHPVVVTEDLRLVAGKRRLEACRQLGWSEIPTTTIRDLGDAADQLAAERDENACRKDMTPSELYALGQALEELERPKAEERMKAGAMTLPSDDGRVPGKRDHSTETAHIVGSAMGLSGATYQRLKHIGDRAAGGDERAEEIMEAIDNDQMTISGGYAALRARATPSKPARFPAEKRTEQIQELAGRGCTARQIGAEIGLSIDRVRLIARQHDIRLADAVAGNRQRLDPEHILSETVSTLEGVVISVGLVDPSTLDSQLAAEWSDRLGEALRPLNRFAKAIREVGR